MSFVDSLNSLETSFENFIAETETDVQAVVAAFGKGLAVAESALSSALGWVAKETPTVVPIIEGVIGFAAAAGVAASPGVGAAVAAAQLAITELNSVAQSQSSGLSPAQTLLAAYTAYTQAQSAGAAVKAATVGAVAAPAT